MAHYTHDSVMEDIEALKDAGKFAEALKKVNQILIKDPNDEDALLQVTDIQYRQWEIGKAGKAIDFLNSRKKMKIHFDYILSEFWRWKKIIEKLPENIFKKHWPWRKAKIMRS
jgi:DNA-binding SARP family transcriptional activator